MRVHAQKPGGAPADGAQLAGSAVRAGTTPAASRGAAPGFAFDRVPILQAKLAVGESDDPAEREADRVAEQVAAGRQAQDTPHDVKSTPSPASNGVAAPPIVGDVLSSAGRPLDPATRADFEGRFGRDFSTVRVHADAAAADSASAIGARAYTAGRHIVFGAGQYSTNSNEGRKLISHELTHTVQQNGATGPIRRQGARKPDGPNPVDEARRKAFFKALNNPEYLLKSPIVQQLTKGFLAYKAPLIEAEIDKQGEFEAQYGTAPPLPYMPTESEVYSVIYGALQINKLKGGKVSDWELTLPSQSTAMSVGTMAKGVSLLDNFKTQPLKGIGTAAGALSDPLGYTLEKSAETLVEDSLKFTAEWLEGRELMGLASLFTGAGELFVAGMLVWGLAEFFNAMMEDGEKQEKKNKKDNLLMEVMDWLGSRRSPRTESENLFSPFGKNLKLENDHTIVNYPGMKKFDRR